MLNITENPKYLYWGVYTWRLSVGSFWETLGRPARSCWTGPKQRYSCFPVFWVFWRI